MEDPDFKCKITDEADKFSIFNVGVPIGEIIYEENKMDADLKEINSSPQFQCFVNRAQSATFNEFDNHKKSSFIS